MLENRNHILTLALMTASPLSLVVGATPVAAQERAYNIKAQPLATAVLEYGRQAGIVVVAPMELVKGKRAPAVQGNMTSAEALEKLLVGSGLRAARGANGGMALVRASAAGNASGAASGGAQQAQGQATLVGSVRDHKTGAALKGARVEVVETGASTSTGDLGDFRFTRLPAGDVSLRVSYLGFPAQTEIVSVVGGLPNRTEIYLGSGATSEIVVIGQVSARAQALNQERTAENSTTVISGDLLGNFNGTTISDSLRRAPGIAFVQDPNSGDGTNIIVRGLSPDYNQIKLNGLALPDGSGIGRAPSLNNILSDSVAEIKISKTLLASQDSYGTGGLVEIETKSPLDRPKRYFNLSAEGTKYGKGFGNEYLASGTASMRFGAEGNFGVSASVQYRKQDISLFRYSAQGVVGPYLPLLDNGLPASPQTLDPRMPFPFYEGADYLIRQATVNADNADIATRTINLSAEWQVSPATNLRIDYVQSRRNDDRFSRRYDIGAFFESYDLAPVASLGGEPRYVFTNSRQRFLARSTTNVETLVDTTDSINFRGESAIGALSLKYSAGHTEGRLKTPFSGNLSLTSREIPITSETVAPEAINPLTGTVVTIFGPRVGRGLPAPLLTPLGFERLRNESLSIIDGFYSRTGDSGRSSNWHGEFSGKYEFGSGLLKYLEGGVSYTRSSFKTLSGTELNFSPVLDENFQHVPLGELGIEFDDLPFSTGAGDALYRLVSRSSFEQLRGRLSEFAASGLLIQNGPYNVPDYLNGAGTREEALAGYLQARIDIGKVEVIAGVRLDRNRVQAKYTSSDFIYDENFNVDEAFALSRLQVFSDSDTLTSTLPRLLINYRPQENIVIRGGYYSTVARPQIQQLNSAKSLTYYAARFFGPTGSQPLLSITAGNPALKPAWSHNFDLSGEWYDGKVGVIKLSAFYKRINKLLETNQVLGSEALGDYELPDHPVLNDLPDDVFVQLFYPVNSAKPATVWGVEASVERQLTFLPGVLSGLGIYANYVYSRSSKTLTKNFNEPLFDGSGNVVDFQQISYQLKVPFNASPRHSGTAGLTYTRPGFDASLYYSMQARGSSNQGADYGLDRYTEAASSLDLRAVYQFKLAGRDIRMSFEGRDLLRGKSDPIAEESLGGSNGIPKYYTSGSFLGGRKFTLGLSATF
jgi:TonB-dependent receptor